MASEPEPDIVLSILTKSTFFLIIIFLISYLFFYINRTRKFPVNWPVIGMLGGIVANCDRLHDYMTAILRESGGTAAFKGPWFTGMSLMLTCDPANANHIFGANFANYPKGDELRQLFDPISNGILGADGDLWKYQRKMAHPLFNNHEFMSTLAKCSREKVANAILPLLGTTGTIHELQDVFKKFILDITCSLVLGVDPCSLAPDNPSVPFAGALDDVEEVVLLRHTVPMFWWKLKRVLGVGTEKTMAAAEIEIDRFIAPCIAEKREDKKQNRTSSGILSHYLHLDLNSNNYPIDSSLRDYFRSDKFLLYTALTFLSAGKGTTGSALSWFFHLMSRNPDVEKKILNELRGVRSSLRDSWAVFDYEDIKDLVYLHAALCETMRLFPPAPFNHRCALEEDVLPSGHRVKPGTKIIFSAYSMARMENVWGEDCLEFKPERWISGEGRLKHEPSYKFLAFHTGPRLCVGKSMAFVEMKVLVAAVIYNFHVEPVEGHVAVPKLSITLPMKNGLMARARKRERIEG